MIRSKGHSGRIDAVENEWRAKRIVHVDGGCVESDENGRVGAERISLRIDDGPVQVVQVFRRRIDRAFLVERAIVDYRDRSVARCQIVVERASGGRLQRRAGILSGNKQTLAVRVIGDADKFPFSPVHTPVVVCGLVRA